MSLKNFFLFIVMCLSYHVVAQDTLLYETFQSGTLNGFSSLDVDGLPLSEDFESLEGGFQVLAIAGASDFRAIAVSSFRDGGTANNFLISPPIAITQTSTSLRWTANSLSGDPSQAESYEVLLSRTGTEATDFTDILEIVAVETGSTREVDLSFYAGSTVHIAFRQNGTDKLALTIDDILITSPSSDVDAELEAFLGNRYLDVEDLGLGPAVLVNNIGAQQLTDIVLDVTVNGITSRVEYNNLNIDPQSSGVLPLNITEVEKYVIEVSLVSANGVEQSKPMLSNTFFLHQGGPVQTQLMEVATSTTCGWCPGDIVAQDRAAAANPDDLIALSVHFDDDLVSPVYAFGIENLRGFGGVPSASYNRDFSGLTADYQDNLQRGEGNSPLGLEVSNIYDPVSRAMTVDLSGTAFTRFDEGDLRLSLLIVEDSIVGTTELFDQANFYSAESQNIPLVGIDGRDWQAEPDPVPASNMIYNRVVRDLVGGFDGIIGSVPATSRGETFDYQIDYILPSVYDENQVSIVALVLDATDSRVLQAIDQRLDILSSVSDHDQQNFKIFPNPARAALYVVGLDKQTVTAYQLVHTSGRVVMAQNIDQLSDNETIRIDCLGLTAGMYTLRVTDGFGWENHRVMVIGTDQ
jgi:hypothetical protein